MKTDGVGLTTSSECFTLCNELAVRIKTLLNSHRKLSPVVRINMPFDRIEFDGGLRISGKEKRSVHVHGVQRYTIAQFQDLNRLLGTNWHFRGINANGDFCYVILNTVEYYVYHRRPLKEFMPPISAEGSRTIGYVLVLTFVRGDGTSDLHTRTLPIIRVITILEKGVGNIMKYYCTDCVVTRTYATIVHTVLDCIATCHREQSRESLPY
jgi:hypothetical protein